jgi:hypothetical protein
MKTLRTLVGLAMLVAANVPLPVLADVTALVIGIDDYASKQALRGSVADASDLAAVLRNEHGADVVLLEDQAATRANVEAEWSRIVGDAAPDDLIFVSFSGHGIRSQAGGDTAVKGFLLQPYSEKSAPDEILTDEHLYDLFAEATAKGARVFFVADACHAGNAVRAIDGRARGGSFRFQRFDTSATAVSVAAPAASIKARPANPGVTVFSAADERMTIQEVLIGGTYRGALSYAVARGLEGPPDQYGWITADALHKFVSPLVRSLSGNRQIPQFMLPDRSVRLLSAANDNAPHRLGKLPTISLSILGDVPAHTEIEGATLVQSTADADLIWDAKRLQLVSAAGDVLASGVGATDLYAAIDARRVVEALNDHLGAQTGQVELKMTSSSNPDGTAFFLSGDRVSFDVSRDRQPYLTLVDLNANGNVQLIWPLVQAGDDAGPSNEPLRFAAPVTEPFGADYVIAIASDKPLSDLNAQLAPLHNSRDPEQFYAALAGASITNDLWVGINALFSCAALRSNGQCDTMIASSQ